MGFTLSNYLAADSAARALRDDVSHGLRQTRNRCRPNGSTTRWAVNSSTGSPGCRVLPDPDRGADPAGRGTGHRGGQRGGHPRRVGQRDIGEDPAAAERHARRRIVVAVRPVDVDAGVLESAGAALQREYPSLQIDAVCGDFEEDLAKVPGGGRRLFAFLGSTIGNLTPQPRARFLAALAETLQPGDCLLLGTDLVKDTERLVRATTTAPG